MADDVVIRAEGLGKKYVIGHAAERERYVALRDVLARGAQQLLAQDGGHGTRPRHRRRRHGRGILGAQGCQLRGQARRGAGHHRPQRRRQDHAAQDPVAHHRAERRAVTIDGRVASLLEVGTGFHPELTGRENIYLNGAILGMTRAEIRRKFDEIVAFAEVEKFLDTPVKRYSSGMYVRLAFAVAAHLEPEILVVDEVLAVGDAEFQKKCLGKIGDVACHEGRTVLFVSHNMQALMSLCSRALVLDKGKVAVDGVASSAVSAYLERTNWVEQTTWSSCVGLGDDDALLKTMRVYSDRGELFFSSGEVFVEPTVDVLRPNPGLCIGFDLIAEDGTVILRSYDTDNPKEAERRRKAGSYKLVCTIDPGLLHGRHYAIAPRIGVHWHKWIVNCDPLISINVIRDHAETPYGADTRPGLIAPVLQWQSNLVDLNLETIDHTAG